MVTGRLRRLLICFCCLWVAAQASALPWGKDMARGRDLPRAWGIGIDIFSLNQDYEIEALSVAAPGLVLTDASGFAVENRITEINLKLDAWLLPFLNVYAIVGELDGKTTVDLRGSGLGLPFETLRIDYDGLVYGGGLTLAAGGNRFFGSLTVNYTETDLSGDFDSSVEALVLMPKVGLHGQGGSFWIGAMNLSADESHTGRITIPVLGSADFAVELQERDSLHWLVGGSANWGEHWVLTFEGGFGEKTSALMSFNYRF